MKPFTFTVIIEGVSDVDDAALNRLYEAGCGDCTPCVRNGELRLTFTREAETAEKAIDSALADVARANIGGTPQRVERDLRQ